jgi:hypothetical protein
VRKIVVVVVVALSALLCSAVASAHVERSSYWPDPAPDTSITPAAGGAVPTARTLVSAVYKKKSMRGPGTTRVVCQTNSLALLRDSIRRARASGYDVRPHDHRSFSKSSATRLLLVNKLLMKRCKFSEIQPAVMASGNSGRVIVMPGLYTEPTARAAKTNDPACAKDHVTNDRGDTGAVSYAYQFHCPNDQNLIAVLGRALGPGKDPATPLEDRRGIPNVGPCIRCNLQVEGSGVGADDVIIEAGDASSGDKAPMNAKKDVGIRVDRADGFVLRNVKVRHAREHAIYVLESDGYLLDRFKTFYAGEYGVLTFVEDHGLMQNCEAAGSGDSGLYPGAGAEMGTQRKAGTPMRYSQEMRFCDSHHNAGGYSGTDGNSTWVHDNNFYDNALGFTTDVFTAPGHPGFPQDSDLIERNNFYDNNFNPYVKGSDITPSVPVPVGTGLWIAGGNDNVIRNNYFYDNNRRGVMLFGVPDSTVCSPGVGTPVTGCDPAKTSTSYNNRFYGNVMGVSPSGEKKPNGVDFWWDSFPGNTGNCWWDNHGIAGKPVTTSPAQLPECNAGRDPSRSMGAGAASNEAELLGCFGAISSHDYSSGLCPWFVTPPKPAAASGATARARPAETAGARIAGLRGVHAQVCRLYGRHRSAACPSGP